MGRLGEAALADPTEQRSSWLAVNRAVNSGAYVLTLGLWEAKIAWTARTNGWGARRQHMISVLLTLALVAICSFCFWCAIGKTTLVSKRNSFIYYQNTSGFFDVTFYPCRVS